MWFHLIVKAKPNNWMLFVSKTGHSKADKIFFTFAAVLQDVLSLSALGGKRKVGTTQGAILLRGKGFVYSGIQQVSQKITANPPQAEGKGENVG